MLLSYLNNNVVVLLCFIWYYKYMSVSIENNAVHILTRYWDNIERLYVPMKILNLLHK